MNNEQITHAGSTIGQRARLAAVKVGEVIGFGGLLTAVAVEGGAALNLSTPVVQVVEAGTLIQGVTVTGVCGESAVYVKNNRTTLITPSFVAKPSGKTGNLMLGPGDTGAFQANKTDTVETSVGGVTDTESICPAAVTTTTTTTTIVPPNTGGSIPGGEKGTPVVSDGPATTTTTSAEGGYANKPATGDVSPAGQQGTTTATTRLPGAAVPQAGRSLALTGNKVDKQAGVGVVLMAAGGLLVALGRRKKQQPAT